MFSVVKGISFLFLVANGFFFSRFPSQFRLFPPHPIFVFGSYKGLRGVSFMFSVSIPIPAVPTLFLFSVVIRA
jgi:hypothetical protein